MRFVILTLLVGMLLTSGCSAGDAPAASRLPEATEAATGVREAGQWPPQDDPDAPREDVNGGTPSDVVLSLIDAGNRSDWPARYSLYTNHTIDYATAQQEWQEAAESYSEFEVLETRVWSRTEAAVRVAYRASASAPDRTRYGVDVPEPGEWWPLFKVEDAWKVQWMPRQ